MAANGRITGSVSSRTWSLCPSSDGKHLGKIKDSGRICTRIPNSWLERGSNESDWEHSVCGCGHHSQTESMCSKKERQVAD